MTYALKKKHNFNLIQLFRNGSSNDNLSEFTMTFGYNYSFGLKKPKEQNGTIRIQYKKYHYEGLPKDIIPQLLALPKKEGFANLIEDKKGKLVALGKQLLETQDKDKRIYREIGVNYLKSMNLYLDFIEFYNEKIYKSYLKLIREAKNIDREIRDEYTVLTGKINSIEQKDPENTEGDIMILKKRNAVKVFSMYQNKESEERIVNFIEIRLADLFHRLLEEYE